MVSAKHVIAQLTLEGICEIEFIRTSNKSALRREPGTSELGISGFAGQEGAMNSDSIIDNIVNYGHYSCRKQGDYASC